MSLNKIQERLLQYVYHSQRESLSEIAKQTGLTRTQVEYNLKILEEQKIIKKYLAMFNYGALGYNTYIILLAKLERFSTFKAFSDKLDNSKHCISWGQTFGKYDIFVNLIFKSEQEVQDFLSETFNTKDIFIEDYLLIKPYVTEFYPLKLWKSGKNLNFPLAFPNEEKIKLDHKDIEIIKIIEKDSRMRMIDIAKKLGISAELALYKVRELYKNNVILGTRTHLDMKKIDYNYSGFFLHVKNFSNPIRKKIADFAKKHKLTNALVLSLTKPNCFLQVFHKTEDELKETISELKNMLKDEPFEMDVLLMNEEDQVNTLPFFQKL